MTLLWLPVVEISISLDVKRREINLDAAMLRRG